MSSDISPQLPTTGFIERLKRRLQKGKDAAQNPDRVTELAAEIGTKLANARDLRFKQTEMLKKQVQFRKDAPLRRMIQKAQSMAHASRIRRPLKSVITRDVFAAENAHGDVLYMSLSNGQLVRADRPHKNPLLRQLISDRLTSDTKGAVDFKSEILTPSS